MKLWTLGRQATRAADFVRYWSAIYDYDDDETYTSIIGKPLTKRRLMALFRWKNGGKISASKTASIERNYVPNIGKGKSEDDVWALVHKGAPYGAVWNIFFAHCLMPSKFPIYDQHVHRAMTYLQEGVPSEIPTRKQAVIKSYRGRYVPFYESFKGSVPRSVDRALWAFGKFIKANPCITHAG